jgi:hypothetical protein
MKPITMFPILAALTLLAVAAHADAQQFSPGAILATAEAPKQAILSTFPQVTRREASAALTRAQTATRGEPRTASVKSKFAGLGSWCGGATPPNPALAVGPTFVVQVIKPCLAVYDKSGNMQPGFPVSLKSIPLFGPNAETLGPRALYDWTNHRYIVAGGHVTRTYPYKSFVDIAVSWSSDPRDGWSFYSINLRNFNIFGSIGLANVPALGQDRRGIYISFNVFGKSGGSDTYFAYPVVLLPPKWTIYQGQAFSFFVLKSSNFQISGADVDSLQPANVMNRGDNPRAEFMVNSFNLNYGGGRCVNGCQGLVIWRYRIRCIIRARTVRRFPTSCYRPLIPITYRAVPHSQTAKTLRA